MMAPAVVCELGHRVPDWPRQLDAVVNDARVRPFNWRRHNCATFAADCVEAMTGVSLHERFADCLTSVRRAVLNAEFLEEHADSILGVERRIPVRLAQRGDVVIVRVEPAPALAVCLGISAAAVGPTGVSFVRMEAALCAWRI